jgi:hypothetical protein
MKKRRRKMRRAQNTARMTWKSAIRQCRDKGSFGDARLDMTRHSGKLCWYLNGEGLSVHIVWKWV